MQHPANRRKFMQTAAKWIAALTGAGGLWAQRERPNPATNAASGSTGALGAEPAPIADLGPGGLASRVWMNRQISEWRPGPWRKVVIEFHNSRHMQRIGEGFNADEFGDLLVKARVTGATVWAKDMYGYFYYPTKLGPVHPGLSFDLLGAQVAALRKRKIQVMAYYMTSRNPELAERHPEWLVVPRPRNSPATGGFIFTGVGRDAPRRSGDSSRDADDGKMQANIAPDASSRPGVNSSPQAGKATPEDKGYRAGDSKFCIGQDDYVKGALAQIKELVGNYELDGLWLDGVVAYECYCPECLRQMRQQGLDPLDANAQRRHKAGLHSNFLKRVHQVVKETRPGCLVCPQNQCRHGFAEEAPLIDYSSMESLFSWPGHGYYHYPTSIRLARNWGVPIYGFTTRFMGYWADFGGLKSPTQMHTEMATVVAHGGRCNIGDQIHPAGRLDPAVYHVIGHAYGQIEKIEPWLDQAMPVSEAALISDGRKLESPCTETNFGWVKLLTESRIQFDIVEPNAPWERYALVVLPEAVSVSEALAARLHAFIAGGGAVVAAHRSGLLAGTQKSWLDRYGLHYAGMSRFTPAYMIPRFNLAGDIPSYEYALYEGATQWRVESPATALAMLGEPLFQRGPEHYTSHMQTPFDHITSYAAVARSGRVALMAFPLGQSYYNQGYWIYREAFRTVLGEILPARLLQTDAHQTTELTLTHQTARPDIGRKERHMVHVVNFSPARRTPKHTEYCDDPIPLHNVTVRVNLPLEASTARVLYAGIDLPVRRADGGGVEVVIPKLRIHEVVCFERG